MTENELLQKRVEHLECTVVGIFYVLDQLLPPEMKRDVQLMCSSLIYANEEHGADIDTKAFYDKYQMGCKECDA